MTYPYKQTQPSQNQPPTQAPAAGMPAASANPEPTISGPATPAAVAEAKKWLIGALIAILAIIVFTVIVVSNQHDRTPPPTTPTPGATRVVTHAGGPMAAAPASPA